MTRYGLHYYELIGAVILASVMGACSGKGGNTTESKDDLFNIPFPKVEHCTWTILASDDVLPFPDAIAVNDSVISMAGRLDGKWIHTYNRTTGQHVGSYVGMGQAPDEVVSVLNVTFCDNGSTAIVDGNQRKILSFNGDYTLRNSWHLDTIVPNLTGGWLVNSDQALLQCIKPLNEEERFSRVLILVDFKDIPQVLYQYETKGTDLNIDPLMIIQPVVMGVSPDSRHFAVGSKEGCLLEFFEINGDSIVPRKKDMYYETEFLDENGAADPFPVRGFTSMAATDKYLIASYGATINDFEVNKVGIWDWSGNPVKLIQTDASIFSLTFDKTTSDLYGVILQEDSELALAKMKITLD